MDLRRHGKKLYWTSKGVSRCKIRKKGDEYETTNEFYRKRWNTFFWLQVPSTLQTSFSVSRCHCPDPKIASRNPSTGKTPGRVLSDRTLEPPPEDKNSRKSVDNTVRFKLNKIPVLRLRTFQDSGFWSRTRTLEIKPCSQQMTFLQWTPLHYERGQYNYCSKCHRNLEKSWRKSSCKKTYINHLFRFLSNLKKSWSTVFIQSV